MTLALEMDQAQFSRIENGKTDPSFSTIEKIAHALGVKLVGMVNADEKFKEVNSYDKSIFEKLALVDQLGKKGKVCFLFHTLCTGIEQTIEGHFSPRT